LEKKYRIRIVVPANTTAFNERILDAVRSVKAIDFEVDVKNICSRTHSIENRCCIVENSPAVLQLARETEKEGYDGIFITDFDYCGVEACREAVSIPVIGGFQPSAFTAMMLSKRFAIITILESVVTMQLEHIYSSGIEDNFVGIHSINCSVNELKDINVVRKKVFEESLKAIRLEGAQSIILGCTGFIDIADAVSEMLRKEIGSYVPVIDPNKVALGYLAMLVRSGLSQSRLSYSKVSYP
jgi:allantoin racemase